MIICHTWEFKKAPVPDDQEGKSKLVNCSRSTVCHCWITQKVLDSEREALNRKYTTCINDIIVMADCVLGNTITLLKITFLCRRTYNAIIA